MIFFSIIIPVKSINDYVRENIAYIQNRLASDWEVLISPNEHEPCEWNDGRIKIIPSGRVGPSEKRDYCAGLASGKVLVFLDDDSYPSTNYFDLAKNIFTNSDVIAIGGPGVTPAQDSFWEKVSGAFFLSRYSGGAPERYLSIGKTKLVDDWPSVNLMVKRDIFLDVGGFDSKFWPGEDTLFCLKLKDQVGKLILYVPELIVFHHRRASFIKHLNQIGAYGLHRGYFAKVYPDTSRRLKYFLPSLFFLGNLLFLFALPFSTPFDFLEFKIFYLIYSIVLLKIFYDLTRYEKLLISLAALLYVPPSHAWYGFMFINGIFSNNLKSKLR